MNPTPFLRRIGLAAAVMLAVLGITIGSPLALVAGVAAAGASGLNYQSVPFILGASYPVLNTTTTANLTAENAKVKEELWPNRVLLGSENLYQDCPLSEPGFFGRIQPGQKPDSRVLKKAIVELMDLQKVHGTTINVTTYAGFGGPGVQGSGTRVGNALKAHTGTFPVTIGRQWYGIGYQATARDETMIGGRLDKMISDGLRYLFARKRNDDHLMRFRQAVVSGIGTRNLILPDGATAGALKTAQVLSTDLISNAGAILPGFGGLPIDTTNDSGGSVGELFIFLCTDHSLRPVKNEPAYLSAQKEAGTRGDMNRVFKGGFSPWDGHGLYSWIMRDHANRGPIGSPLSPRARLGYALTGADTGSIIHGGGNVATTTVDNTNANNTNTGDTGDGPAPEWFTYFSNAPWTFHNGDTIAAVENVTKYLGIYNSDGTGGAVYSYRVNNGKAIVILGRISMSGVSGFTETNTHPVGSLILECDSTGVPFNYSVGLAAEAIVCGAGSIDGKTVGSLGKRTEEHMNHDMDHEIGTEGVWGNALVKRAGDNAFPNFLLIKHAIPVIGASSNSSFVVA